MVTNWSICATEKGTRTETAPLTTIYSMRQLNLIWYPVEDVLLLFFFPPFISWEGNKSRANRRQHSITEHLVNLWNSPQEVASKSNASVGWFLWLLITAVAMQTKVTKSMAWGIHLQSRKQLFLSSYWSHLKALLEPFEFFSCIPGKSYNCYCNKILLKC